MLQQKPNKIASFDIDAQRTFTPLCPDELPVPEGDQIVSELNKQATFADFRLGSKDAHPANPDWLANEAHPQLTPVTGEHVDVRWNRHATVGSEGCKLLPGLPHPAKYDYFVWKGVEPDMHPYGACYHDLNNKISTGVIEFLCQHKVNTVIVGGLATDYCVKMSVLQLLDAGFAVIVNLGACRGITKATTATAVEEMQAHGACIIKSADELKNIRS